MMKLETTAMSMQLDDQKIRIALKEQLRKRKIPLIVEEFELFNGQSRIDLFIYDQFFTGIEIKSERDTLIRLPNQIETYNRYLEKIEIIVGSKHLSKVTDLVPKWWGVTSVNSNGENISFKTQREARLNPLFRPESLLEFLWKDEMVELLTLYGYHKGIKSQCRYDLRDFARNFVSHKELKFFVFDFMQRRMNWRSDESRTTNGD